ncbi:methyltransferase [Marinactinospora thermotolerans]|uniref:16S RNA G1207 methylase RsmC n=2 Tax=Marinactinospora thermotolerans TaxID=531310 RepID=A0A1T4T4T7_9ACTN|nr:methyltransferase [Marinactinospora thermotolerans]SKA35261.1 16S RNA G1207 methylase RsmC [Marinactinospora thermotolerans DSM 45154]
MATKEPLRLAEETLERAINTEGFPDTFTLLGREWTLRRGVFPGTVTAATEVMASALPYPVGGSFLEVGSGSGVISVTAALRGVASVTALDINTEAVANTEDNARLHGVESRVRSLHSDLFAALAPRERFDLVFWNVPWTWVPNDFSMSSRLHSAVFDPGYRAQARFIAEAHDHLAPGGRVLIGTADLADGALLERLAGDAGRRLRLLRRIRRIEVHRVMEYWLLELLEA